MQKLNRFAGRIFMFLLVIAVAVTAAAGQQNGRYQKQGNRCEWDANDSGPDQCNPRLAN